MIKPFKPLLSADCFSSIPLKKEEVDISDIETKAISDGFKLQTNRHITIIGRQCQQFIMNKLENLNAREKEKLIKSIKFLLSSYKWEFAPKDIYLISKKGIIENSDVIEEKQSYIRLIDMPHMKKFYNKLNELLDTHFPAQFPHITLFTKGDRPDAIWRGISVTSKEEFELLNPIKFEF